MSDIVWEDPPEIDRTRRVPGRWQRVAQELRQHPGKWALAYEGKSPGAPVVSLKKAGCQVVERGQNTDAPRVYARWPEDAA